MQWWCFSQSTAWTWEWQAYPGVWIFAAAMAAGYARRSGVGVGTRRAMYYYGGVLLLWAAFDWPLGPLGASYLASAHMVQFLLVGLVAPAFLLLGLPPSFFDALRERPRAMAILSDITHPLPALVHHHFSLVVELLLAHGRQEEAHPV